jgi:hypothetical protein
LPEALLLPFNWSLEVLAIKVALSGNHPREYAVVGKALAAQELRSTVLTSAG